MCREIPTIDGNDGPGDTSVSHCMSFEGENLAPMVSLRTEIEICTEIEILRELGGAGTAPDCNRDHLGANSKHQNSVSTQARAVSLVEECQQEMDRVDKEAEEEKRLTQRTVEHCVAPNMPFATRVSEMHVVDKGTEHESEEMEN